MNIGGHPGRVVMDGVSKQAASRFVASHASHSRSPMAGVSWNEAEHLAFLKGLQVFGKVCVVLIYERWSLEPGSYGLEARRGEWQEWQTVCPGLDVEGHLML